MRNGRQKHKVYFRSSYWQKINKINISEYGKEIIIIQHEHFFYGCLSLCLPRSKALKK